MNLIDLAERVIRIRQYEGHRYPESAAVDMARRVALEVHPNASKETVIDAMCEVIKEIERPFYSNPEWDGSIG